MVEKGKMKNKKVVKFTFLGIILLIGIYLIFFIPNGKSNPDTGISNCTNLTIPGETYFLSNDIVNNQMPKTCINITVPNVTLNCQGHAIYSIQNYSGIYSRNTINTTIENCNITVGIGGMFYAGIYLINVTNGNVLNNIFTDSGYTTINLFSGSNNVLMNNTIINNYGPVGIEIASEFNDSLISNFITTNSGYGIWLTSSNNSLVLTNNITANSNYGINVETSANNNTLISNNVTTNSSTGIVIASNSYNATLTNNVVNSISGMGIYVQSRGNNLTSNVGTSNSNYGINLYSITTSPANNFLTNNTGISNSSIGIVIQYSSNNTLMSNTGISNSNVAIYLYRSNNITLTNNTAIANGLLPGIYLANSSFDILTYNNMSQSTYGFGINAYNIANFNNIIDTTNILNNSYLIYYNSSISNYVFDSNNAPNAGMIVCGNCNNITVADLNLNGNWMGLYFSNTSGSIIRNVTSNQNNYGIYFDRKSNNNLIINSTTSSNLGSGIYASFSTFNNTVLNSIVNNNRYGLYLDFTNYFNITNITAKNNSLYGIMIQGSSYYNTITNSFIQFNSGSAFILNSSTNAPRFNSFYNNYFNNSVAFSNISASLVNYFNTTKTAGTNIVGGNYIGGNYWAAPNGTGFSQICTSSTDGICDTAYNFDGVNFDYLPLACVEHWSCGDWAGCSGNVQKRICIDSNLCQTYKFKPSESQVCDSGGHVAQSQGGAGGATFTQSIENITSVQPVEITINNSRMDLSSLTINVKNSVSDTSVNITTINQTESGLPIGKLYQAFEINPGIENSNIINATINFKINKTWLSENNITFHSKGNRSWLVENDIVGNVILYRNPKGVKAWFPLTTNFFSEDNQYYYFSAYSPGFSTFAIFLNRYDCLPNSARCDNNEVQLCVGNSTWLVTDHCSDTCDNGKCTSSFFKSNQFYFLIIIGIIAILVIGIIIFIYKKRKEKRKIRKEIRRNKRLKRKSRR